MARSGDVLVVGDIGHPQMAVLTTQNGGFKTFGKMNRGTAICIAISRDWTKRNLNYRCWQEMPKNQLWDCWNHLAIRNYHSVIRGFGHNADEGLRWSTLEPCISEPA